MMKLLNARESVDSRKDALVAKFFKHQLISGDTDCLVLNEDEFNTALKAYYKQSGWDEITGLPAKEILTKLGLDIFSQEAM